MYYRIHDSVTTSSNLGALFGIDSAFFYRPRSEGDNVLGSVRPSVRPSVRLDVRLSTRAITILRCMQIIARMRSIGF